MHQLGRNAFAAGAPTRVQLTALPDRLARFGERNREEETERAGRKERKGKEREKGLEENGNYRAKFASLAI